MELGEEQEKKRGQLSLSRSNSSDYSQIEKENRPHYFTLVALLWNPSVYLIGLVALASAKYITDRLKTAQIFSPHSFPPTRFEIDILRFSFLIWEEPRWFLFADNKTLPHPHTRSASSSLGQGADSKWQWWHWITGDSPKGQSDWIWWFSWRFVVSQKCEEVGNWGAIIVSECLARPRMSPGVTSWKYSLALWMLSQSLAHCRSWHQTDILRMNKLWEWTKHILHKY